VAEVPFDSLRSLRALDSAHMACHERGRDSPESSGRHGWTRTTDLLRVKQAL